MSDVPAVLLALASVLTALAALWTALTTRRVVRQVTTGTESRSGRVTVWDAPVERLSLSVEGTAAATDDPGPTVEVDAPEAPQGDPGGQPGPAGT